MAIEGRISRLEGAYEQVDKRLGDLNRVIESLRSDLNNLRSEMSSLRAEMNSRFNNIYVLIGASWMTLIRCNDRSVFQINHSPRQRSAGSWELTADGQTPVQTQ